MNFSRISLVLSMMLLLTCYSARADYDSCLDTCLQHCFSFGHHDCVRGCDVICKRDGGGGAASTEDQLRSGRKLTDTWND